ncbi:hypothetical protein CSAL01_08225 [Colletotrichum salicis]|uniref:Uncharacterized protein n=1 Tax=Colletotrichum salicis TaxID=1209931 RepID=A0A135V0U7_9PEZI|nr:hypothetical protein CSAL01_08225 [Colletotrichum salicis]
MADDTGEIHEQPTARGHVSGFWKMTCGGLPAPNWDTTWAGEPSDPPCKKKKIPRKDLARQHEGCADDVGEANGVQHRGWYGCFSTHFPYPVMSLPPPVAEFDFRVAVKFDDHGTKTTAERVEEVELAEGVRGFWSGSLGSGAVIVSSNAFMFDAGGHDDAERQEPTRNRHQVEVTN